MKTVLILALLFAGTLHAQIDRDALSLDVGKAEAANHELLKEFIWKKASVVTVEGEVKMNTLSEFKFDEDGKLQMTQIEAKSDVRQKPGIRGKIQMDAASNKQDYAEEAINLAIAYTYMSKGQLLDYFSKALFVDEGESYEISATDVLVKGDRLTVWLDKETNLFTRKKFFSTLDEGDKVNGEIEFATFSSGVRHVTKSTINMTAKSTVIESVNQDYSKRVN